MKNLALILLLTFSQPALALTEKEQNFLDRIGHAYQSGDDESYLKLFHQDGLYDKFKEQLIAMWGSQKKFAGEYDLDNVTFEEFTQKQKSLIVDGFRYSPNLEVIGKIVIPKKNLPEGSSFNMSYPYGEYEGKYFAVGEKREAVADGVKNDKYFVIKYEAQAGAVIKGFCEFIYNDGSSSKEQIDSSERGFSSLLKGLYAQEIKSCVFTNTAKEGFMFVGMYENHDSTVFEEEAVALEKTEIVYQP